MYGQDFFYQAFVYLAAAVVAVPIAKRLGLGSVLGYLIAGMAIGPFGLGLIGEEGQDVMHFAEFGVVMMLFVIGLELRPSLLWRMRRSVLGLGGLQVGITASVLATIGLVGALPWQTSLAVGLILALSSTAIVLQTLAEKGLMKSDGGQSAFAVLLFQDLAVLPMLALLPLLAVAGATHGDAASAEHAGTWIAGLPGWARGLAVLGAVAFIIVAGRFLMRPAFRFIAKARLREVFTAAALLLVIGIALLMAQVGVSPALGTFLAGVVLSESEYRHELESDVDPFKGLLLGIFFLSVGASVDFQLIADGPGLLLGLVAVLLVAKSTVLFVLGRLFGMGLDQNLLLAVALAQGGEFGFVLFSFATQNGIVETDIAAPLVAVITLSMAATPLLMLLNERVLQPRIGTTTESREPDVVDEDHPVIIAGFGQFGSVIGRFLRGHGVDSTVLEFDSDHVDLLRKLGLKVFYGDAARHDLLEAAGAGRAKLLILAVGEHARTVEIVRAVQKHFPQLKILARAAGRWEAYELRDAGVEAVYRDTLDTALRLAVDALTTLGHRSYQMHRAAKTFRRHDEASVRTLGAMRHDAKQYFTAARQQIQDLEELLSAGAQDAERQDSGWDTESLIQEFGRTATGRSP